MPKAKEARRSTEPEHGEERETAASDGRSTDGTTTVVAEGVGKSADDALKDAFRNAVRQVVGAVVDAETLIKNEDVVDDKVLTYSDGFIKKYGKLNETKRDGLIRIKIRAAVERRSVVQKLVAANVTVKDVGGSAMFAEAVSQLDAEQKSAELIKKTLMDLPSLLTAELDGKPDFDEEKSELVVNVVVRPDRDAYRRFVERVGPILKKLSVAQDSALTKGEPCDNVRSDALAGSNMLQAVQPALGGPAVKSKSQWCIWINTFNNESHETLRWKCYVVECDPLSVAEALEMPSSVDPPGRRPSDAKTLLQVDVLDLNQANRLGAFRAAGGAQRRPASAAAV